MPSATARVFFVNRFFHPDLAPTARLASEVAFDLAAAGWQVHAVSGRATYADPRVAHAAQETVRGVVVHRIWTTRFGRASLAGRALDYATFYASAAVALFRLVRAGDLVVAKSDPPLIGVIAAFVARRRGAVLVNWMQDLFPEIALRSAIPWVRGPVGRIARRLRDWSVRVAALNVVPGERMASRLGSGVRQARLSVVPNWADAAALVPPPQASQRLRLEWGYGSKFVVGYSGNLGRAHDWQTLLEAARLLAARDDMLFSFIGGGHYFDRVRAAQLPNVRVRPYVPDDQLGASLAACDVHLVSQSPAFEGLVMPSKLYGILAAERPVVFVGDRDGEVAGLVLAHECGIVVDSGDAAGLAAGLLELRESPARRHALGRNARVALLRHWNQPQALRRWRDLIDAAARPGVSPVVPGAGDDDVCI